MDTVIDYSAGVPSAQAVKRAGHVGAVRYISPPREAWMKGKPVHRQEIDDYDAHGLKTAMVWQFGKVKNPDVMRGYDGGVADAQAAQAHLINIRCAGHPVFFAVDFDIDRGQWDSTARAYFEGAASVIGKQRVGIYGHADVVRWARDDEVVARVDSQRILGWVTKGYSKGQTGSDYAVLYQRVVDTKATPGPVIDGVTVDVNDIYHPEWGWRALGDNTQTTTPSHKEVKTVANIQPNPNWRGDPTWLPDVLELFGVTVKYLDGWDNWGEGDFTAIDYVIAHHTAGANTPAEYIARNPGIGGSLSSQLHLARNGVVTLCGVGIAYHAGLDDTGKWMPGYVTRPSASGPKSFTGANARSIGIEAVNAGDGSQPWPQVQMDAYYRSVAAILWYLGLPVSRVLGHKEIAPRRKIDPNFSMDEFRVNVQYYLDNPPFLANKNEEFDPAMQEKINRIFHEMTHKFRSRYKDVHGNQSNFHDTLIGYVLEQDRKNEDIHANMLPTIYKELVRLHERLDAIENKETN